ncbi:MAG: PKD domain-containing protein [Prevotellaceae bacterium]|nr:PKD domain-containing protein [Prevotellaceae bacterium]
MNRLQSSFIILVIVFLGFVQSVTAQTLTANPATPVCSGTPVTLTATGGASYIWSTGEIGSAIVVTPAVSTHYEVIVKDASEVAIDTLTLDVTVLPLPTISIDSDPSVCAGQPITLTALGTGTFLWKNGSTASSITVNPVTDTEYWVEITDANGCKNRAYKTIQVNALPTVSISGPTEVCIGGTVSLVANGGVGFLWDDPLAKTTKTLTVKPLVTTTYTCQISDANGCMSIASHTVNVTPALTPTISGINQICVGGNTILTAYPAGASYEWNNNATTRSITVSPGVTTDYTVIVTKDGCTASATQTITVNQKPTPQIAGQNTICRGEMTTLTASAVEPGSYSYLWNTGATTADIQVAPLTTTSYSVTVTNQTTGCSNSTTQIVTVDASANPTISGPATVCSGSSITLTASAGASHLWDDDLASGSQSIDVSPTSDRIYTVWVTNAAGCTYSATHSVTVTDAPGTIISGIHTICKGGSTTLTAPAGDSYSWSNGSTQPSITVTPASTTDYYVDVTKGSCVVRATQQVTVNEPIPATITGLNSICGNASTGITLTASAGTDYLWSTGETTPSISVSPASSTVYSVTVTDNNGCTSNASHLVSVTPLPNLTITGATTVCEGNPIVLTVSGAPAGSTYLWSDATNAVSMTTTATTTQTYTVDVTTNGCTQTLSQNVTVVPLPTGVITGIFTICQGSTTTLTAPAGGVSYYWETTGETTRSITTDPLFGNQTYKVKIVYAGGCEQNLTQDVTVVNPPTGTITGTTDICLDEEVNLTVTAPDAVDYTWSNGVVGSSIMSDVPTTAGVKTYWVDITNATGCTSRIIQNVNVVAKPSATVVGPTSFCLGETLTLTANGGTSYVWSTGETTQSISPVINATTLFTVTVKNASGCETTVTHSVTANPLPVASISGDLDICVGESTTLTAVGGGAGGSYNWDHGAATASVTVSPTTDTEYIVTVTDAKGCKAEARATVRVYAKPNPTISGDVSICLGESATLTANTGTAWFWTPGGATTQSINVTPSATTTYAVEVTGLGGCKATANHTVTIKDPVVGTVSGPTTSCAGEVVTLIANGGQTYRWDDNVMDGATLVVSPNATTTYYVNITGSNGCVTRVGHTVTVNPKPTIGVSGNLNICKGASTTLTASGGVSYLWNTGVNTASITVNPLVNTPYTVTVTDAKGCTNTKTVDVTVTDIPVANITGTNAVCEGSSTTLTASGGASYLWSTGATTSSVTVSPLTTTTYTVVATTGSCVSDPFPYTVTVTPKPIIGLTGDSEICEGETAVVTATGGDTYVWSTGQTGASITTAPLNATTVLTVTATKGGCTNTAQQTIVVNKKPVITIYGDLDLCAGEQTTLTATAGQSYLWSNGATTQSITLTPLADTNVSVQVTDNKGCVGQASVNVLVHALPTAGIVTNTGLSSVCRGKELILTASGGTSYVWETGERTASITVSPLTETTYRVQAFGDGGCSTTAQITIQVLDLPTASVTGPLVGCAGDNITLTASAGTDWLWSTGATTQTITIVAPPVGRTEYTVEVFNAAGCSSTAMHAVVISALPNAAINGDLDICVGESTILTASGGDTYLWDDGSTGATRTVTPASTQSYSVTATKNGCSKTVSVTVNVNALPTPSISGTADICNGQSSLLTANGGGSYYRWSTGQAGPAMTSILVSPNTTTVYEVEVTNASGCKNTAQFEVRVTQVAAPTISAPKLTICAGESVTLTSSAAPFYQWSSNAGASLNSQSVTVSPTTTTTYTVTTTNNLGCISSASITINVIALPTPTITGNNKVCLGSSTTLTANGGVSYRWNTGATTQSINVSPTDNTTYSVVATNAQGCENTIPVTFTVQVNPTPTVSILGVARICRGTSTVLQATGGVGFLWADGRTTQSITVSPSTTTTYTCTITDNNGCSAQAMWTVTVDDIPVPSIVGSTTICAGASTTLTASGGNAYEWSGGAVGNNASLTVTPATTTTYTVKVTNANGCFATKDVTVTVIPQPVITVTGNTNVCAGGSTTLTASCPNAVSYSWSNGGSMASTTVSPTTNTTYTVTVVTVGGCTATKSVPVTVSALPTPQISAVNSICAGETVTLTASLSGGGAAAYSWNTGATTPSITVKPTTATTYTVTATNAAGCQNSVSHTVAVNPLPIATITGPNVTCSGEQVRLIASGAGTGGTYLWSNGFSTQDIYVQPNQTTTYEVTVTNSTGCSTKIQHTVTVSAKPAAMITGPTHICVGSPVTLVASGGTTYTWSTGATGASISVNPPATRTYSVTVTNASGCDTTINHTVNVLPAPEPTIIGDFIICLGESTTLTVAENFNTYRWNTGATSKSITVNPLSTTLYSVEVTNADGCIGQAQRSVVVNDLPVATIAASSTAVCEGQSVTLTANGAGVGGSYRWSTGEVQQSITLNNLLTNTTVSVVAIASGGCESLPVQQEITVSTLPNPSIAGGSSVCQGGTLQLVASDPDPNVTFVWNDGTVGGTLVVSAAGTYTVTATNAGGCTAQASKTVAVAPLPTPTITASIVGTAEAGEMICAGEAVRLTALPAGDYTYLWNTGETSSQIIQNPVATTTYSVTVTSDAGCSAVAEITIRVNEFVQIQTPSTDVCTNVPFVLSAVGDNLTQFLWSTGETTPNITATLTTPGVHGYWVEARNTKDCISRATMDITAYELPNDLQIIGPADVCVNSPATLSVVGSVGPTVTYLWSPGGQTTSTITVTPSVAGLQTYSCQVTTQGGCVKSLTHTINAIELPQLTVTGDNSICQGTSTTLTVACASGCVPGTTFVWSNGGTGTTITVSPTVTTTYTVTARTPFGCTTAANYPVTVIPAPQPTITPNPTVICLDEFGIAEDDLILTGPALDINGNPYLAHEWTTTDAPAFVLGTSAVLNLPKAGITSTRTYVLKVTTQDGCIGTVNRQVAVSAKPSVAISGEDKVCQGKSLVLKAVNPVNVNRYEWTANDNPALILATTATATVWPTATANQFTLTVYNDANCSFETSHTVTILPVPVPNITADNNPICSGDTVVLTASGGGPGALYEWGDGTVGQTLQVNALKSTTTYTVTITNSNGCVESGNLQVVVNELPELSINGATTVCVGDSVLLVVSDANGLPNTYRWSSSASTGNQIWVKPTDVNNPTTYWVESTDVNTCKSTRVYHSIQAYAKPIATVAGDRYLCAGEQTTLIASGGTKFKWSNNAQTSQITTPVYTVPGNYMFWVDVYNEANCVTRDTVYVQVSALPSASVTFLEGGSTICQGETIKFQGVASPAGPIYNYLWTSNNPSEVIDPVAATQPQITFKPQINTTYYLTVTNTTTGCARTVAQAIVVKPKPAVTLDVTTSGAGTDSICEGQSVTLRVLGGTASYTYVWTKNGALFAVGVSTITDTPNAGNFTYEVQVTDPATGCSTATDDLVYKVNVAAIAQPTINGLITGGETICEGETVTLTGNAGGYTYRWESDPTGAIPAGTTINVAPIVTTTYKLIARNATGCEREATYVITVTPKPHITMTSSLTGTNPIICAGEKVTLSLSGTTTGLTYVWTYNGAVIATDVTTITHEPLAPISEYKVVVTNTSGCSTGDNELVYTVNVNPVPSPTITLTSGNDTICEGDPVILTANEHQQAGYSYMWISSTPTDVMQPNEYGEEITVYPIATTTYSYTVTDNLTGCSRQAQQRIVVNAKPNVTIAGSVTGSNPTICEGSPITVSVTGANLTGLTFEWKKDGNPMVETTSSITDMPAAGTHTYNVVVRSAVGCSSSVAGLSYTVKVTPVPTPTIVAQDGDGNVLVAPVCPGSEVTLVGPTGLSSDYAYLWTTNSGEVISNPTQSSVKVNPQVTTTYTLRITNTSTPAQCYREVTKVVDVHVMPTIAVTSSAATVTPDGSAICKGERITLTVKAADGTALAPTKYSFAWVASTGAAIAGNTSAAIQVTPDTTTTYTVTVTNKVTFCKVATVHKVTVMTIPTDITIVPSLANPVCALTPVTLTASYKDGLSYRWTDSDGNELINNGSDVIVNGNKLTVKPTRNTTYYVQVSNLAGCATSVNYSVVVNPLPTLTVSGPTLFCLGDVGGSFTLVATTNPANAVVTWVYGNETKTGTTLTISPSTAGMMNFRVTATNTLTGCVSSEVLHSVSVAGVPENTELKVISSTSGEACVDNVVKLEATYGFTRYDFGKTDGTIYTVLQSSNVNIFENLPHTQGTVTYFVDIYNEAGCKVRKELPVQVNPIPSNITVDASGANIFDKTTTSVMICEGDSVILAAQDADTGHNTYSWTDTDGKVWGTSQSIKVGPRLTTTYYLTVTNNSGCSLVKSYEVRVTPMDKITVTASKNEICEGSGDAVVLRASGSPTGSYMWTSNEGKQWFNSTSITVYPEVDGTDYIVEATSSTDNRCSSTLLLM